MTSHLTAPAFSADDPAIHDYIVQLASRSAPAEQRVEHVAARDADHAREMAAYLFPDSVILRVQPERRRAAAYPDARFIKGEFLPTADADLMAGAGAD